MHRVVGDAGRAEGLAKRATCHTLCQSFTPRQREACTDIPPIETLLGHKDVRTMMSYTHIVDCDSRDALSRLNR